MIGDPNSLYSTIAQSSAAIVAIVGGFITASVLMLASDKRSLRHQKADRQARLEGLEDEERQLSQGYETSRVDLFLDAIADALLKAEVLPSLDVVMERYPHAQKLDPEILKRQYERLSRLRLEARRFIGQHARGIDVSGHISFDDWIGTNRFNIAAYDRGMLETEYCTFVADEQRRRVEEQEGTDPFCIPRFELPDLSDALHVLSTADLAEERRQEHIGQRLSVVRAEIQLLRHFISDLDRRLASFRDPQDLRWGLCVLSYLAAVGILFPLLVIAQGAHCTFASKLSIGFFFSGLTAIVAYIVSQINKLRA